MDRWAKAKSILTSMGSDVNGPTQLKDPYIITRRKIEKRDHEYVAIFVCLENFSLNSQSPTFSCSQSSRGFPDLPVILIRTKKHNNGLCMGVSHLGALFNHNVQNNELNGKILMSLFSHYYKMFLFFGKMNAV